MDASQIQNNSEEALPQSATTYQEADVSAEDFEPSRPFKALHIGGAGNIIIKGVDGVNSPAMAVTAGCWPYGGIAIISTGTTATDITALF